MPHEIRSITQVGTCEPFELQVSRGQITAHYRVHKFGFNPLINDSEETIWDVGGLYTYPQTAVAMTVDTGDPSDETVQITVQGLDGDYNQVSETVTLNASGAATTTQTFLRVFRAFVQGDKDLTSPAVISASSVTYAQVSVDDQQTLMCVWTVPAGYTAYLYQKDVSCLTEANNKFGTIRLLSRKSGGVFRTHDKIAVQNDHAEITYSTPIPFTEKTDIEVRAIGSSSNSALHVSAALDIVYIKNEEGV